MMVTLVFQMILVIVKLNPIINVKIVQMDTILQIQDVVHKEDIGQMKEILVQEEIVIIVWNMLMNLKLNANYVMKIHIY